MDGNGRNVTRPSRQKEKRSFHDRKVVYGGKHQAPWIIVNLDSEGPEDLHQLLWPMIDDQSL
jgi:hypothetical protein